MFVIEEELKKLPAKPGVYLMHDEKDEIIYVGKAISLKNRVRQYFQSSRNKGVKIEQFGYDMHYSPEPDTLAYLLNCGVRIEEVQVKMYERVAGTSYLDFKGSIWYMMKMLFSILLFQWVRIRIKGER